MHLVGAASNLNDIRWCKYGLSSDMHEQFLSKWRPIFKEWNGIDMISRRLKGGKEEIMFIISYKYF